jgi:hypothetical protein
VCYYVDVITLVSVLHIKSTAKVPYVASVYYTYKLRHKHFKTSVFLRGHNLVYSNGCQEGAENDSLKYNIMCFLFTLVCAYSSAVKICLGEMFQILV